jgi:DNA-binding CsgD family transcriptional regulator
MATIPESFEGRCGECLLYGAIQGLADGMVLTDLEGRIILVNRRAEELLGLAGVRLRGTRLGAALRHQGLLTLWDATADDDGALSAEIALGGGGTYRATAIACMGAGGARIGRALLLRDVTKEKTIQVELTSSVARRLIEMAGGEEIDASMPALTRRERQVLALLAGGLSNKTIAARLRVSLNTVASHLKNLYPKLKVANRSQAAAFAVARGIRPPSN